LVGRVDRCRTAATELAVDANTVDVQLGGYASADGAIDVSECLGDMGFPHADGHVEDH